MARRWNERGGGLRYGLWRIFPSAQAGWFDIYTPGFVYAGSARGIDAVERFIDERYAPAVA